MSGALVRQVCGGRPGHHCQVDSGWYRISATIRAWEEIRGHGAPGVPITEPEVEDREYTWTRMHLGIIWISDTGMIGQIQKQGPKMMHFTYLNRNDLIGVCEVVRCARALDGTPGHFSYKLIKTYNEISICSVCIFTKSNAGAILYVMRC